MSRWVFVDIDLNETIIDDDTFRLVGEDQPAESDIVERSHQAGAENPGIIRDTSKALEFEYIINFATEVEFRDYVNEFLYNARKAVYIKDTDTSRQIKVNYEDHENGYIPGGFRKGATNSLSFTALTPYWEDISFQTASQTGDSLSFSITNTGWVIVKPILTITASVLTTKFSFRVTETGRGILINDLQFGALGLTEYIVNCVEGTSELNGISREGRIKGGTGFFSLPVGSSTVEVELTASATVKIDYKRRYYI